MGVEPVQTVAPVAKDFDAIFNKVIESSEKAKRNMCHDHDIRSPCTLLSDRIHTFTVCL